jgi:hypothetical protein
MSLASLSIDITAKTATFEKDLKRAADLGSTFATVTVAGFTAIASGATAAAVGFDRLVKSAGNFQDLAEQVGASAEGLASLSVSASVGGTSMEEVSGFAIRLTKNLTGVDDESTKAGAALKALGLDIEDLKAADPADQMERIAKALDTFDDGTGKTAVMEALAKGGAKLLPFLKELAAEGGRQVILTKEMIEQADAYADSQARSRAKLSIYAQALATEAIPALTAFQDALTDTAKDMMGVAQGATSLKANDGVREFAKGAVGALGFVVDAADGVYRVVSIIGKSIGAIGAAGAAVASGEFKMAKSIMAELGSDVDATLNRGLFSDKLQKRLAEIGTQTQALTGGKKGKLTFDGAFGGGSGGSKAAATKIDENAQALARYVSQLESATEKALDLTEVEKARIFLTTIGTTGEIAQVQELVLGMAKRIDQEKELGELLKLKRATATAAGDAVNKENEFFASAIAGTPTAKLEKQRADMVKLAEGFQSGAFGNPRLSRRRATLRRGGQRHAGQPEWRRERGKGRLRKPGRHLQQQPGRRHRQRQRPALGHPGPGPRHPAHHGAQDDHRAHWQRPHRRVQRVQPEQAVRLCRWRRDDGARPSAPARLCVGRRGGQPAAGHVWRGQHARGLRAAARRALDPRHHEGRRSGGQHRDPQHHRQHCQPERCGAGHEGRARADHR